MAGIANDVKQIRQALYGREVREAIAHGIEQCYSDVTASKTVADTAAAAANTATQNAQTATQQANQARDNAQAVADGVVNQSITAINDAAAQQRQSVNDLGDQLKDYLEDNYGETTDKVAAKANRSSISVVKHAIGADGQITLTDALNEPAKKMTIHLEPKQDLHGYDKPWVGGAGKNKLPTLADTNTINGITATVSRDGTITLNGTGTGAISYFDFSTLFDSTALAGAIFTGFPDDFVGTTNSLVVRVSSSTKDRASLQDITKNGLAIEDHGSNLTIAIRVFSGYTLNNFVIKPMLRLPTETGDAYEPYSNICPIEGFDTVVIASSGSDNIVCGRLHNITVGSTYLDNAGDQFSTYYARIKKGEAYTLVSDGAQMVYAYIDSLEVKNGTSYAHEHSSRLVESTSASGNWRYRTIEAPIDGWVAMRCNLNFQEGAVYRGSVVPTIYVEPNTNHVPINLVSSAGSTVYGGTVTVNEDGSGTLTVDRGIVVIDKDSPLGVFRQNSTVFYLNKTLPMSKLLDYSNLIVCDKCEARMMHADMVNNYSNVPGVTGYGDGSNAYPNQNWIYFTNGVSTTYEDITAWLASNPLTVVYPLSSTTTYQLTATQLQTLVGTNHIWTDRTSIELDYYADKYGLVDRLLAAFPKDTATGNPATFTDGADDLPVEKLEIAIEPNQDLHGYDHPWVGGAGKNLLGGFDDYGVYGITIKDTVNGISISGTFASGQTQFSYTLLNKILPTGTYVVNGVNGTGGSSYQLVITGGGMSGTKYGATNNTTFTSDGTTAVIVRLFVYSGGSPYNVVVPWQIESGTTPTTYEPYSNICPITGWDAAEVTKCGKNLFDPNSIVNIRNYQTNNELIGSAERWGHRFEGGHTYYITVAADGANTYYKTAKKDGTDVSQSGMIAPTARSRSTVSDDYYLYVYVEPSNKTITDKIYVGFYEDGTDIEPYKGNEISIPLKSISGSTVYGGKLVVNLDGTGTLTVTKKISNLGDQGWNYNKNVTYPYFFTTWYKDHIKKVSGNGVKADIVCNQYETTSANIPYIGNVTTCICSTTNGDIFVYDPRFSDVQTFIKQLNGAKIVFPLLNPITYSLTAPQVTTLLGMNHISCDAGEVTVTYHADPTLFITKKIAQALNA